MAVTVDKANRPQRFGGQVDEWPYGGFPTGWFQIGWEEQLEPGGVKPERFFGKNLVRYRGTDGTTRVLDAHCPHQGAHMGHGGWVEDDCIVCPFHGWHWDGEGQNRMVPSEGKPMNHRQIRSWPVSVTNGIVWIWHDAAGGPPAWEPFEEVPEYGSAETYPVWPHCVKSFIGVRGRPQYLIENNADVEHLRWVHRAEGPMEPVSQEADGPLLKAQVKMVFGYGKKRTRLTPDGPVDVHIDSVAQGVGSILVRFSLDGAVLISSSTPVEDNTLDIFQTVITGREPGDEGDEPTGLSAARVREQFVQVERDFIIWENMNYVRRSPLTRDEGKPMGTLRRWAAQFYPAD